MIVEEHSQINDYWLERGKTYADETRLQTQFYRDQEEAVVWLMKHMKPLEDVLELGCGFGRVTRVMAEAFPKVEFRAFDLSTHQIFEAQARCSGLENVWFDQADLYGEWPARWCDQFNLAVAIEVFLHHPAEAVLAFIRKARACAGAVLHEVDWSDEITGNPSFHVWRHDYEALYRAQGWSFETFKLGDHRFIVIGNKK